MRFGRIKKYLILIFVAVILISFGLQRKDIQAAPDSKVTLNKTNITVGIGKYHTGKLEANVTGAVKDVIYTTSNSKVAIVSDKGVVTGVAEGEANITCSIKGTHKKAVCKVTVITFVESIKLENRYINFNNKGETYQIELTISPVNSTKKEVSYSVSDTSVATVDSKGQVTAVGPGKTTITVKALDGSKKTAFIYVKYLKDKYDAPAGIETKMNVSHGKVKEVTYYSSFTGNNRKALIYTPPGYSKNKKYNVLYLCHGMNCDHKQWEGVGAFNILDNLYAEKKVEDMILVLPNCYASANDENTGMDGKDYNEFIKAYDDFEYEMVEALMPYIEKNYSVYTGSEHTAIAGLSMGGRETCNIGLKRTDLFGYMGIFSPAPTSDAVTNFTSVLDNEVHKQHPPKVIWLSVGTSDDISVGSAISINTAFEKDEVQKYFKNNNVNYIYYEIPKEGHSQPVWQNGLYNFAQIIFK